MGPLTTIALIVLLISFTIFVIFFGRIPALRKTPIHTLHILLTSTIPSFAKFLDRKLTNGVVFPTLSHWCNFIAYGRHPTVLIFFFVLLSVGEYLYLPVAWPSLSLTHRVLGIVAVTLPYIFLYLATCTDPGWVTPQNVSQHQSLYPYDFVLFHPGQVCRTCRIPKPARSKHCAVCDRCVAKCDHHCVFINACVGYGNQRWFLLLLISTAILVTYGGGVGLHILGARAAAKFPGWSRWKPTFMAWDAWLTGWGWGMQSSLRMGSVTLLALVMSPMVWALLGYQVYLVWAGTTTNETMKWADWKAEMDDGCAFTRALPPNRPRNLEIEPRDDGRWPVPATQILVRTEDGTPPAPDKSLSGVGEWIRVWNLRDVKNIYDLGFWDNMADVFVKNYGFGMTKEERNGLGTPVGMLGGGNVRRKNRRRR